MTHGSVQPHHVCVLLGGPDCVIVVNSERIAFEDHPQMGPCPLTRTGTSRPLGHRHAFWDAVTRWYDGGKVVRDGVCVWTPEPSPLDGAVHVGGRHWRVSGK